MAVSCDSGLQNAVAGSQDCPTLGCVDVQLHSLSGEDLGTVSISSTAWGRELVATARSLLGEPRGFVTLVCGEAMVKEDVSVVEQCLQGAVQCVIAPITEQQESSAKDVALSGKVFVEEQWQAWAGLTNLHLNRLLHVPLPSGLRHLSFDHYFNQSLDNVVFPSNLQVLTFGVRFNQSLDNVTLPNRLQSLSFGYHYDKSLEKVTLPSSLQSLTFGYQFNQSLEKVTIPASLQNITFGQRFNQSLNKITFPKRMGHITLCSCYNKTLEKATFPKDLQLTWR